MSNQDSHSHISPTRLSGVSGSSQDSVVTTSPLPPEGPVFKDVLDAALAYHILEPAALAKDYSPARVFEILKDDPERRADIVHATIGTLRAVVLRRDDPKRYIEDINAGMEADPEVTERFVKCLGVDFYQQHMTSKAIYEAIMGTGWMLDPKPGNRGFAAELCDILLKHQAFGGALQTLRHIYKSITREKLFGNETPAALRIKMIAAVENGMRTYGGKHLYEYAFEEKLGGVTFMELAQHLPIAIMGHPFAAYAKMHKLVDADVDTDSVLPKALPSSTPQMMGAFVPHPPKLPPFPPGDKT